MHFLLRIKICKLQRMKSGFTLFFNSYMFYWCIIMITQDEIGGSAHIWPVITYGAEGCTLKKDDERRLEAAEMWCYRRMLRISWTEKRTNKSILDELQTIGANSLPKLSKEKWLSLDMHAETISVIL